MNQLAAQLRLEVETVPIGAIVLLPHRTDTRWKFIGLMEIPMLIYTIPLSNIARSFDTDLEDGVILVKETLIDLSELKNIFKPFYHWRLKPILIRKNSSNILKICYCV